MATAAAVAATAVSVIAFMQESEDSEVPRAISWNAEKDSTIENDWNDDSDDTLEEDESEPAPTYRDFTAEAQRKYRLLSAPAMSSPPLNFASERHTLDKIENPVLLAPKRRTSNSKDAVRKSPEWGWYVSTTPPEDASR